MSLLIKGMKMPDKCLNCPFMISRDNDDCVLQSTEANELAVTWEDLKSGCPLVELPKKHGDLIDRDGLLDGWMNLRNATKYGNKTAEQQHHSYSTLMMYEIADEVEDAQTVIEAEGE